MCHSHSTWTRTKYAPLQDLVSVHRSSPARRTTLACGATRPVGGRGGTWVRAAETRVHLHAPQCAPTAPKAGAPRGNDVRYTAWDWGRLRGRSRVRSSPEIAGSVRTSAQAHPACVCVYGRRQTTYACIGFAPTGAPRGAGQPCAAPPRTGALWATRARAAARCADRLHARRRLSALGDVLPAVRCTLARGAAAARAAGRARLAQARRSACAPSLRGARTE